MPKKILLVTNVQTIGNPALLRICQLLEDRYSLTVYGKELCSRHCISEKVTYKCHAGIFHRMARPISMLLRVVCGILAPLDPDKRQAYHKLYLLKTRLALSSLTLGFHRFRDTDFVINIDTEAAIISMPHRKKHKIPSAYFIYEIYAEQTLDSSGMLRAFETKMERAAIDSSSFLLSGCNEVCGEYLNHKYALNKKILSYTTCPEKQFSGDAPETGPVLKFYYHGALFDNRGLKEAIEAMKDIEGAVLYLRGFGYFEEELKRHARDLKLTDKVQFLDPVPTSELPRESAKFDLGLTLVRMNVLNHIYAMGFKTFENISAGIALILPESYPLKKLNETYQVGLTYPDATVEHLRAIFKYCVEHPEEVRIWKNNARKAYESEFNPKVQGSRLTEAIESELQQS